MAPNVTDEYQVLSDVEHVLVRPGMYIGSCDSVESDVFIADASSAAPRIVKKRMLFNAGLVRVFEEILLNAYDHSVRDSACNDIRVYVSNNEISVRSNGAGIPVVIKQELGLYIPEILFGMLRSGSSFSDSRRIVGGMNGVGASLCVLFSQRFTLETVDSERKLRYVQTWIANMTEKSAPKITASGRAKGYTFVTFTPDLARFGMERLSQDTTMLLKKRLIDIGFTTEAKVKTYFNDEKVSIKRADEYIKLYDHPAGEGIIADTSERWTVGVVLSSVGFQHASFVNGIHTSLGGTHVDHVVNQLVKEVTAKLAVLRKIK